MGYDCREISYKWYTSFDERHMCVYVDPSYMEDVKEEYIATDEDGEELGVCIPVIFEICDVCQGKGKHVNPSIDSGGLSSEDFDEDPDFRENYFSGMYDVECVCCRGRRVIPTPNYDSMDKQFGDMVREYIDGYFQSERDMHYERNMGY